MELHPATLWEAFSDAVGDRPAIVQGARRVTWREFDDRAARLATVLLNAGVGAGAKVGQLLYNSPEFLESYFAALKVRAVPFNINYRYTADEVTYLLDNAGADALVYHSSFGPIVAVALSRGRPLKLLIRVDDEDGSVTGSVPYEPAVAAAQPAERIVRDPDDITMIYTGGTTGMPKGVVSKVGPTLQNLLETVPPLMGLTPVPIDDMPGFAANLDELGVRIISLPAPPLMHNTGLGIGATPALDTGGTVVLLESRRFDAAELWDTVVAQRVNTVTVVGDAFARPMLAELRASPIRDLTGVRMICSSGAMFSTETKAALLEHLPNAAIIDIIAATEGTMGMSISTADSLAPTGRFQPASGVIVITEDERRVEPGSGEPGLVALPGGAEGYFRDDEKTAATFRIVAGQRYAIPGDYATVDADGMLTLLGRGSSCINTAGEKVYPEEVEEVLKAHPALEDALVFGVADERFGHTVAAVVSYTGDVREPVAAMLAVARQKLAAYKLPRAVVVVDEVPRTQVGKPDYPTARILFDAGTPER